VNPNVISQNDYISTAVSGVKQENILYLIAHRWQSNLRTIFLIPHQY